MSYDWTGTCPTRRRRPRAPPGCCSGPVACVFVFLILAALYESWSLPFSVLLSVPVAIFGAFLGLTCAAVAISGCSPRSA